MSMNISAGNQTDAHYRTMGSPYLYVFERALSQIFDHRMTLGVKGQLNALVFALRGVGVMRGDEVILPAFCPPVNVMAVREIGAIPIFVDICSLDYAIDGEKIEERITDRTKAILVTHLFGQPAICIEKIVLIAQKRFLPVVENAAQAFLAKVLTHDGWKYAGMLGDIGCLNFLWGDVSTETISGLIFRNRSVAYEEIAGMRFREKMYLLPERQLFYFASKYKNFTFQLALRNDLARYYRKQFRDVGDIICPEMYAGTQRSWYRFVIRTKSGLKLREYLQNQGVASDALSVYALVDSGGGGQSCDFPMSMVAAAETVSIPIFRVSREEADLIVRLVKNFFRE